MLRGEMSGVLVLLF